MREDGKAGFQKMDEFEELVPELAKFQPLRGCQHVFPRVLNNMRGMWDIDGGKRPGEVKRITDCKMVISHESWCVE